MGLAAVDAAIGSTAPCAPYSVSFYHLVIGKTWMPTCAQVFMLSADQELNEATLQSILNSGHSRIPIHKPGSRRARRTPSQAVQALCPLSPTSCCAATWPSSCACGRMEAMLEPHAMLGDLVAHMQAVAGF